MPAAYKGTGPVDIEDWTAPKRSRDYSADAVDSKTGRRVIDGPLDVEKSKKVFGGDTLWGTNQDKDNLAYDPEADDISPSPQKRI